MNELMALARANPGGYGTSPHIASERLFKLTHGVDIVQVPFQGGGPAVLSTLAGQTDILHITLPLVAEHAKAGKLRALAVADKRRSTALPDVPTSRRPASQTMRLAIGPASWFPRKRPRTLLAGWRDESLSC
jgi:tripartite-type tricarboxylate transporter receptor subunit TctC